MSRYKKIKFFFVWKFAKSFDKILVLGIVKEDQNLSKEYYDKLSDIIEFMLRNRLSDFYENYAGGIDADVVKENLGVPMIDLDMHQIIYCEQTLDDEHIFEVEYGEDFNDLLYCSVDG